MSEDRWRPTRSLLAKIADELRHNDDCAPGPLSADEYMDDARAILRIVDEHRMNPAERTKTMGAVGALREIAARSPLGTSSEARVIAFARQWLEDHGHTLAGRSTHRTEETG